MPFVGTDIGGFGSDTTPELLARWIQVGCFSPFCRNHSALGTRRQEPWLFGEEVLQIYRKYVKLRYQWLPYIYDLFYEGEKTGVPVMRPLVYHYEKDEVARTCNDEFLLGDKILVAPVVNQGMTRRMVYLPKGEWYDYWTRYKHVGPVWFMREAPLDVYPGSGSYDHYLDNGSDFAYRDGKYHQYHFTVDEACNVSGEIVHAGYEKPYERIIVRVSGRETELKM